MYESILSFLFHKPKFTLILSYENGQIEFIVGIYPEFQSVIEGALSAQFSECSIEVCEKPNFFTKKHTSIAVLEPERDTVYTIKTFKQMPDDPLNNLIDSIAKVEAKDNFYTMLILKPIDDEYNHRVKYFADALYKKQTSKIE
jgi:hypothetical protein